MDKKRLCILIGIGVLCTAGISVPVTAGAASRRSNIKSAGNIDFQNGTVHIASSDLTYLADEIDNLENTYKITTVDALNTIGTYFQTDGTIVNDITRNEIDTDEEKTALSFGSIKKGIIQSQSVDSVSQIQAADEEGNLLFYATKEAQANNNLLNITIEDTGFPVFYQAATAENLTAGSVAWVNGIMIKGTGTDNQNSYNQGVVKGSANSKVGTAAAAQVLKGYTFTNSADIGISGTMENRGTLNWNPESSTSYTVPAGYYSGGTLNSAGAYNAGVTAADNRVNTNSTSYTTGYDAGVTAADNRVNADSTNYKTGYNAGYDAGKAAVEYQTGSLTSDGSSSSISVTFSKAFTKTPAVYIWPAGTNGGAVYTGVKGQPSVSTTGFSIPSIQSTNGGSHWSEGFIGTLQWIAIVS